jgi:hypothetical protein
VACGPWFWTSLVLGFFLLLSIALLWGGFVVNDKYQSVDCVLTKISGCQPICVDVNTDGGGGGGGGGGEKRVAKEIQCKGAQFTCSAQWTIGNQTFQASDLFAYWWTNDFSCDNIVAGMKATVTFAVAEPGTAIDIYTPGYTKAPALIIIGGTLLALTLCAIVCAGICFKKCKDEENKGGNSSFQTF